LAQKKLSITGKEKWRRKRSPAQQHRSPELQIIRAGYSEVKNPGGKTHCSIQRWERRNIEKEGKEKWKKKRPEKVEVENQGRST